MMRGEITKLKDVSLPDQAREMIRSAILEGALKPDERFTIEDIAARLGISRTPVREALKALEVDGMVRLLPHRGAVVESYAYAEIQNRFAITAMLESYAAELAMRAAPHTLVDKLQANCDELERLCQCADPDSPDNTQQMVDLNRAFHTLIREASGSATLLRLLSSLRQPTSYTMNYWKDPEARDVSLAGHRRIVAAFRKGENVGDMVRMHTQEASERIMKRLNDASQATKDTRPSARRAGSPPKPPKNND